MRKYWLYIFCVGTIAIIFSATSTNARIVEDWPSSKLAEKADVIAIARVVSVQYAKKFDKLPEPYNELVGIETKFKILATIKGKVEKEELILFHYLPADAIKDRKGSNTSKPNKLLISQTPDLNGPSLVRFDRKKDKTKRFLLFLKKRSDGRFECVSGQIDPDISVNTLNGPSDDLDP